MAGTPPRQLLRSGAERLQNLPHFDEFDASFRRPVDHLPTDLRANMMDAQSLKKILAGQYSEGIEDAVKGWDKFWKNADEDERVQILKTLNLSGLGTSPTHDYLENKIGKGAYNVYENIMSNVYKDPKFGQSFLVNKRYVTGVGEIMRSPAGLKTLLERPSVKKNVELREKIEGLLEQKTKQDKSLSSRKRKKLEKEEVSKVIRSMEDNGYGDDILQLVAKDDNYNLFERQYKKMNRNLSEHVVLGKRMDPNSVIENKFGELVPKDGRVEYSYHQDKQNPYQSTTYADAEKFITENRAELQKRPQMDVLENMILDIEGDYQPLDAWNKVGLGFQYAPLTNNAGTFLRSIPDMFKSKAGMATLLEAGQLLKSDDVLRNRVTRSIGGSTQKATEFGEPLGREIIPDFAHKGEVYTKGHIWLASALEEAKLKDPDGKLGLKEDIVRAFKGGTIENPTQTLRVLGQGLDEVNRITSRIDPAFQRPMFQNGAGSLLRLAETGVNDAEDSLRNVYKSVVDNDPDAIRKVKSAIRTGGVKALLFGTSGLVASDLVDRVQETLPEEQQAQLQQIRNVTDRFGLITGPTAALGMDTTRLVQPVLSNPLQTFGGVPFMDAIANVTGDGAARSKAGQVTSGVSSAVNLAATAGRLYAPTAGITQVISSLNPAATGRLALLGLRAVGLSPDSTGMGTYEVHGLGERGLNLASVPNAILGTSPDYRDAKTQRLKKYLGE
jgi:hypothetical protein